MCTFYQTNNEILKFEYPKHINEIIFNHYICRKENLERIKGELPRGQFYLAINTVSKDLNLTTGIVRGLIKRFVNLGIITNIYKPVKGKNDPSIYVYNAVLANNDDNNDINNDTNNDDNNEKCSNTSGLEIAINNDINNDANIDDNNGINKSKKEYIKTKLKNKIKKKYSDEFELLWKMFLKIDRTGNKSKAYTKYKNTLNQYSKEQIFNATEYYFKIKVPTIENKFIKTGEYFFDIGYISDYIYKAESNIKTDIIKTEVAIPIDGFKADW